MAEAICQSCVWEITSGETIDTSMSKTAWSLKVGVSEASIRRHLQHGPGARTKALEALGALAGTEGPKFRILALDLETSPNVAHVWGLWNQNVSIKQLLESTEVICFGARWYGEEEVIFKSVFHDGKQEMLDSAWDLINEADALMGWNSKGFDYKHLMREFFEARMEPPKEPKHLDLMQAAKSRFRFPSNKLDYVAQRLGHGKKVQHSGHDLWIRCMAGDQAAWDEMREYQVQDVDLLIPLYEDLRPWIRNHPNVALYEQKPFACIACGSQKLSLDGVSYTGVSTFQAYRCDDCKRPQRDSSRLSTTALRAV